MSIEVKTEEAMPVRRSPDGQLARPQVAIKPWRRRRYQFGTALLAVLVVAGFLGNNFLARQYTPEGAVRQYLSALQSGDSSSAWSAISVGPSPSAAFILTNRAAFDAALSRGRPDIKTFAVTLTRFTDSSAAVVSVSVDTSSGTKDATFNVRRSSSNNLVIYPGWRVVVMPVVLQLELPAGAGGVSIDGQTLAVSGSATAAVLPIRHQVIFLGTSMVKPQTAEVDGFAGGSQKVTYAPTMTEAGAAKATSAVKAAFATCAQSASGRPQGCPQAISSAITASGQWRIIGDPSQSLAFAVDSGAMVATGHFQMVFDYSQDGVYGAIHKPSAGGFAAVLSLSNDNIAVSKIQPATGLPGVPRPAAATDQAAEAVVAPALKACASISAGNIGACPQLFIFPDSSAFQWTLVTDPLLDARVGYVPDTGVFTVRGDFQMKLNYKIRGSAYTTYSNNTTYVAYLFWDGNQLVLITIDGESVQL